jgi:hypothetical protein
MAAPPIKRYNSSSGNERATAVKHDEAAIRMGPAKRTGRRPRRSRRKPVGTAAINPPSAWTTITSDATANPVSNDFAKTGIAGVAILEPSARTKAGK